MVATLFLLFLMGLCATHAYDFQCGESSESNGPSLTLQFTPSYPTQTAPTSTVFGAIMTSYMNVVDCNYVMVENVDNNPVQSGEFTTRMTVPILTVFRVGCMPETTVVSRRDLWEPSTKKVNALQTAVPAAAAGVMHANKKRMESEGSSLKALLVIAERLSSGIDPTNENMTVGEFKFLREINTALFALNIVNAGLPLNQMCQYLHDPSIGNRLDDNLINQDQAANIICFASVYGLYFQESNEELLADLAALEYTIQMKAYSSETLQDICEGLDYQAASLLGIDVDGIRDKVCNGTSGVVHSTSTQTASTLPSTTLPDVSGVTSPTHWSTPMPSQTGTAFGTRSPIEWTITSTASQVSTNVHGTGSTSISTTSSTISSIIFGTNGPAFSSATAAAGTVAPWFNTTITASADVTTVTASGGGALPETVSINPMFYNPPRLVRGRLHQ